MLLRDHSVIPSLEEKMEAFEKEEHTSGSGRNGEGHHHKMLSDYVSADAIATVVARHTGIPVSRITGSESRKLLHLEDRLRERVVGQDTALSAVSNCVRLARTHLQAPDRTLGNFLVSHLLVCPFLLTTTFPGIKNHFILRNLFSFSVLPELERPSCVRHWQSVFSTMRLP